MGRDKLEMILKRTVMPMANNNKKGKKRSPIYTIGLVFLAYSFFFGFSGLWSIIKCLILATIVYKLVKGLVKKDKVEDDEDLVFVEDEPKSAAATQPKPQSKPQSKPQPEKPASTGNPELDEMIAQGRASVRRIQELNDEIPDFKISAQLKQIEILTSSIIDQVEKKEDKLRQTRQFMNYYLPTTIKLLEQYVQLQDVGMKGENIENGMKRIEDMLDKVIVAFQQQLDSLFEADVVDITADIQVMEQMMAAEGLTGEKDF